MKAPKNFIIEYTTSLSGTSFAEGSYVLRDIPFKFTIHRTRVAGYAYRLHIVAISPVDGYNMQFSGQRREKILARLSEPEREAARSGKRIPALTIQRDHYIAEKENVTDALVRHITCLRDEETRQFDAVLSRNTTIDNLTLSNFFRSYGRQFLRSYSRKCSENTAKLQTSRLEKICRLLSGAPVKELSEKDIEKALTTLNVKKKTRQSYLSLLDGFWDFLLKKGLISYVNRANLYRQNNSGKRKKKAPPSNSPSCLTRSQEQSLMQYVHDNISDGRTMALLLLNGAGIKPSQGRELTWGDISFSPDDPSVVTVALFLSKNGSSTSNYSRPVFRAEGQLLWERYNFLLTQNPGKNLERLPVISAKTDPRQVPDKKQLTQFIRSVMLGVEGITASGLHALPNVYLGNGKQEGKATQLLALNYEAKLYQCGIGDDSAMLDFLLTRSIRSTTGDHYRSLTSFEAQRQIRCLLDRYKPPEIGPKPRITKSKDGDVSSITIPGSPSMIASFQSEHISLNAGQFIECSADKGLVIDILPAGNISNDSDSAPLPLCNYY